MATANDAIIDLHVLAFAGSLRRGSFNRGLLAAAQELMPSGMAIDIFDLTPIPLYNFDVEQQGDPEPVKTFKAAIMGASPGFTGTARAQIQLRQALTYSQTYAVLQPEVLVARAQEKFDQQGRLVDEGTRKFIRQLLEQLRDLTLRLRGQK